MYEAWTRSPRGSDVANFIEAYINVQASTLNILFNARENSKPTLELQYNALLDFARNDSYSFSPSWLGPPPSHFLPWGQLAALDVLNAGIGIAQASPSPSSSPSSYAHHKTIHDKRSLTSPRFDRSSGISATSAPSSESTGNSSTNVPVIAGVVAATVVVLGMVFAIFCIRRRNRRNRHVASLTELESHTGHHPCHDPLSEGYPDDDAMIQVDPHASPMEPFILPSPAVQQLPEKASGTSTPRNAQSSHLDTSRTDLQSWTLAGSSSSTDDRNDDLSAIPGLLERLSRAIAKLPQTRDVVGEGDLPPEYRER